jgi:hypothetical protein
VRGVQMLNEDEGDPGVRREVLKELCESLQAAGRGPDACDDQGGFGERRPRNITLPSFNIASTKGAIGLLGSDLSACTPGGDSL